jgi:hypothetical protein
MNVKKLIANQAVQADKTAWNRKYGNMQVLVSQMNELSSKILELEEQKMPIYDEIVGLREQMVQECIHPQDHLVEQDGVITCKFCDNRFGVN